jgi:hypothetical protein
MPVKSFRELYPVLIFTGKTTKVGVHYTLEDSTRAIQPQRRHDTQHNNRDTKHRINESQHNDTIYNNCYPE